MHTITGGGFLFWQIQIKFIISGPTLIVQIIVLEMQLIQTVLPEIVHSQPEYVLVISVILDFGVPPILPRKKHSLLGRLL